MNLSRRRSRPTYATKNQYTRAKIQVIKKGNPYKWGLYLILAYVRIGTLINKFILLKLDRPVYEPYELCSMRLYLLRNHHTAQCLLSLTLEAREKRKCGNVCDS